LKKLLFLISGTTGKKTSVSGKDVLNYPILERKTFGQEVMANQVSQPDKGNGSRFGRLRSVI
jgi:hypothetical protein